MSSSPRKEEILAVARDLMQTQGYSGFSYQDLSSRLDLSKPSIHHHYPTKEALGLALVGQYQGMMDSMAKEIRSANPTVADEFRAMLAAGEQVMEGCEERICPLGALQADLQNFPPALREATRELTLRMHTWQADLLRRGREAGELFFDGSPEESAWNLCATLQGGRVLARTLGSGTWDAIRAQLERTYLELR